MRAGLGSPGYESPRLPLMAYALAKAGVSWPPGSWMWGLRVVSRSQHVGRVLTASEGFLGLVRVEGGGSVSSAGLETPGSGGPLPTALQEGPKYQKYQGRTLIGLAEVPGPPVDQSQCRKDWRAIWLGQKKQG